MNVLSWITRLVTGAGGLTQQLRQAYQAKLDAQNDADRLAAEERIEKLSRAVDMARIANASFWSATNLGRILIVLPWGIWWAAIYAVSIINGLWGTSLIIHMVPERIHDMALVLVPAIVIADAGALTVKRFTR